VAFDAESGLLVDDDVFGLELLDGRHAGPSSG
jgi:hypothetical protein